VSITVPRSPSRKSKTEVAPSVVETGKKPFLPYGRQLIDEDDIATVSSALRGELLTTGPLVENFERMLARVVGARDTVACSSGTAALYIAARALGLGAGHTVIVPAITFLATASAPHLAGAEIVFADVDPESGLMRAQDLEAALARAPQNRADAVFPVHYAGQSCDMAPIAAIARAKTMKIVEDAAHALGTVWRGDDGAIQSIGANEFSDLTIFSFHPVKTIAMGEGGAVSTNDPELLQRLKRARNHGITREPLEFKGIDASFDSTGAVNPWYYELESPGFNWRISDINCALGISQLSKLQRFINARRRLAECYDELLAPLAPLVKPLKRDPRSLTAWHIYAVRIDFEEAQVERAQVMRGMAADGIGTQVHYIPVHRQPYYARRYGAYSLPGAERYYASTLTLPLHPSMSEADVVRVVAAFKKQISGLQKKPPARSDVTSRTSSLASSK
jgi:UDP-4-amino-4,6-dideoxy-N-acetyl-beta-L-altrosamine transaminase